MVVWLKGVDGIEGVVSGVGAIVPGEGSGSVGVGEMAGVVGTSTEGGTIVVPGSAGGDGIGILTGTSGWTGVDDTAGVDDTVGGVAGTVAMVPGVRVRGGP
ncbi:MAG: hypothetical protein MUC66_07980 [Methanolinea sp.]|jgi:hypothetical protein|nr:hypothetical protein [Methanolinea sp.]